MSKEPIVGSGFKGAEFEKKGLQERNLESLLEIFGSKKTTDSIEKLSKIRPENWEKLAESTQAIIGMAGALDPNIITQVGTTVTDYIGARFDAMIADLLAPYLPAIFDALNNYVFPVVDGIFNSMTIGFGEIFSGFSGIMHMIGSRARWELRERTRLKRWKFLTEEFFPEMDQLYAGMEGGFITDTEIIAEQSDLRGARPGGSQGGIPTPPVSDPFGELEDL